MADPRVIVVTLEDGFLVEVSSAPTLAMAARVLVEEQIQRPIHAPLAESMVIPYADDSLATMRYHVGDSECGGCGWTPEEGSGWMGECGTGPVAGVYWYFDTYYDWLEEAAFAEPVQ